MRICLINPDNPTVTLKRVDRWSGLNKYRVWKPLGLLTLASRTPADCELDVIDENLGHVDERRIRRPDLVGITAFTSQAPRAYALGDHFRQAGVPVVLGGIHVSMCPEEALEHADSIVRGEGESVWPRVVADARAGALERVYQGGLCPIEDVPPARHDLLAGRYRLGSIQTTRGCPLNCSFCSVSAFNGRCFRQRPVDQVVAELEQIPEPMILFVDDNLIGTRREHLERAKNLFRAMIAAGQTRPWIAQTTVNLGDDDELLELASRAGCKMVFIGFESPTREGLQSIDKRFNDAHGRDMRKSVRRIQRHGILVCGSFILGLDTDREGAGEALARACIAYGVDMANLLLLTPLPGTRLYDQMAAEGRVTANRYPEDWLHYTLCRPVAAFRHLSREAIVAEQNRFHDVFYHHGRIAGRALRMARHTWRDPRTLVSGVVGNLTYRHNHHLGRRLGVGPAIEPSSLELPRVEEAKPLSATDGSFQPGG